MKDYIGNIVLFVWLSVMASCQDDSLVDRQQSGDAIVFETVTDSLVSSRTSSVASVVSERHFLGLIGKDSLYISLVEEDNSAPLFSEQNSEVQSRAMYDDDFTAFHLNAYLDDGSEFMMNQVVTKSGTNWIYSPVKYWPQNQAVHFFGYASNLNNPMVTPTIDRQAQAGTFSYALPAAGSDKKDAENQPDLVFAIVPNQTKQAVNGKVNIPFYHALSAIRFKIGSLPGGIITPTPPASWQISLNHVSTSGDCSYTAKTPLAYTWSNTNTNGSYMQQYAYTDLINGISNVQTFMMIPQALGKAKLKISFTYAEMDYSFETVLSTLHEQWEANKKYTYVITINEAVEVDITDNCTSTIKNNVVIKNTGLSDAYIRAAIVGYWENTEGNVVDGWDLENTDDGTITWDANWGNYWIKGTDGFYYYKYPIKVGDTPTVPLFNQYELKKAAPYTGATLKLNIVVQAVKYEAEQTSLKAAWKAAPNEMSATFETSSE